MREFLTFHLNHDYGDMEDVENRNYKFELVNETIDFTRKVISKTYKVVRVIFNGDVIKKILIGFVTFTYAVRHIFGNLPVEESFTQEQIPIEVLHLQNRSSTKTNQTVELKGLKSESVNNLLSISGGDSKKSGPGAKARNDALKGVAERQKLIEEKRQIRKGVGEAWVHNPLNRSRPAKSYLLTRQFNPDKGGNENGVFGEVSSRSKTSLFGQENPSASPNRQARIKSQLIRIRSRYQKTDVIVTRKDINKWITPEQRQDTTNKNLNVKKVTDLVVDTIKTPRRIKPFI